MGLKSVILSTLSVCFLSLSAVVVSAEESYSYELQPFCFDGTVYLSNNTNQDQVWYKVSSFKKVGEVVVPAGKSLELIGARGVLRLGSFSDRGAVEYLCSKSLDGDKGCTDVAQKDDYEKRFDQLVIKYGFSDMYNGNLISLGDASYRSQSECQLSGVIFVNGIAMTADDFGD